MDKFGIFDILTKLASDKTTREKIANTIKTVSTANALTQKDKKDLPKKEQNDALKLRNKQGKYSQTVILEILKKHDKISKEIDEKTKK